MGIDTLIRRNAVLAYFALAFAIAWGGILLIVGMDGLQPATSRSMQTVLLVFLAMLIGPSFTSLVLTALLDGKTGMGELLARWRIGLRWYAIALLTAPLSVVVAVLLLLQFSPDYRPAIVTTDARGTVLLTSIAAGLLVALFEEVGWSGFAIPRLRQRYGLFATALLVGLVWGAWHFPPFWEADTFAGGLPFMLLLVRLFSWLPAYRLLMVWVYDHTESLLVVMLMHASLVAAQFTLFPTALAGMTALTAILTWAVMLWLAVAAVAVINRRQLSRQSLYQELNVKSLILPHQNGEYMTTMRAFIKNHAVLTYYGVVFTISWGGLLILAGPGGIPGTQAQVEALFPFMLVVLFAGPSIAGPLVTALVDGRVGLRDLGARLLRWQVGVHWYAVALLFAPLLVAAVLLALSLFSPAYLPGILSSSNKLSLLLFGIAWGLIGGGLLEELGWTGFAVPKLRVHYSAVTTALIVGVLWGVWHILIAFWSSGGLAGDEPLAIFVAGFLAFYLGALPAYRLLMVWVYDRTLSLPVTMLMHASLSASTLILQPTATGIPYLTWNLVLAVALWSVVAAVAVLHRGQITRRPRYQQVHV